MEALTSQIEINNMLIHDQSSAVECVSTSGVGRCLIGGAADALIAGLPQLGQAVGQRIDPTLVIVGTQLCGTTASHT